MRVSLTPHPQSQPGPVSSIEIEVERDQSGLVLNYRLTGNISRIRLPTPERPGRANDLWRHTCLEAFVRPEGGAAYVEMNFSPSSRWAVYAFDRERTGMKVAETEPWQVMWHFPADGLQLTAGVFAASELPPTSWRLGLSAVIEDIDGEKTYWALAHPSDKPDFHHPDSFTLELPAPETAGT